MSLLLIAVGGAAGAVSRYAIDRWITTAIGAAFPWGTFVVNMSGAFVLGLLFALAIEQDLLSADIRLPMMVGFIGAYTTFSTLMLESWLLIEGQATGLAILNILGSIVVGGLALVAGLALGRVVI